MRPRRSRSTRNSGWVTCISATRTAPSATTRRRFAAYANAEKLSGDGTVRATSSRAWLLAKVGREDEAREILANLVARSANQYVSPYYIAIIYAGLGETDAAFEWLERAVTAGSVSCEGLNNDNRLQSLRRDLRFEPQARRCNPNLAWGL